MMLVNGRTLAALLADRISPAEDLPRFLAIFETVCQTIAFVHARNVIHRDLKPLNIMVGQFGEVQVMDWGLAKVLPAAETLAEYSAPDDSSKVKTLGRAGEGPLTFGVMGTRGYMPPEQANAEWSCVDERADV